MTFYQIDAFTVRLFGGSTTARVTLARWPREERPPHPPTGDIRL